MSLGFVNGEMRTEGSAYYFNNWDTQGSLLIKEKGRVNIDQVNINLYDNTLEALYEENKVFTFDSDNLIRIVINDKVFRTFEIKGQQIIFELFFNGKAQVYRYFKVLYQQGQANPMLSRQQNKYIKNEKYYLYQDGKLTEMKMTKKAISEMLQTETVSEKDIAAFIKDNRLSLKKEDDLFQIFEFANN